MTGNAFFLQQGCNLLDVRNLRVPGFALTFGQVNDATDRSGFLDRNGHSGNNGGKCIGQIVMLRSRFLRPQRQPIINRAALGELPRARIDHEHVGRARDAQGFADQLRVVSAYR